MILNKKVVTILAIIVIIRITMAIALIYGFPEKSNYQGGYFYLGGEDEYFKLAFSLANFKPIDSYRTLGFPILLLPFIWITQANNPGQLFLPVAVFHSCVLAPIAIILITLIAKWLTKEWKIALLSAAIWAIFPYLVYIFVHTKPFFCKDVPAMRMAHQMWLQALSDPPSVFLVLLAISTFLISLDRVGIIYPFLTGISFSLATLARPGNIGLVILFSSLYLYKRKLKYLFLFISSTLLIAMPQFIYNWRFYGSPFKFTTFFTIEKTYASQFISLVGHSLPLFSAMNFLFFFKQIIAKFPPHILLFLFIALSIIIYTLFRLRRELPTASLILTLWILPYILIYGSCSYSYDSVLHYFMPIIPALIIIISIALRRFLWFL